MSNAGIDHGSMGSLRLGHVFFLLKLLYCKMTGFLLLGMGHVIRTASSAHWTVYFTAKHGQKGSNRVPVPRFDLYKY